MRYHMWRRILPVVVLAFLLAPLITGCGIGASASGAVLHIWYGTDDPIERVWSQQLASRFQASHPRVRVLLTDFSFADLNTKLQLSLSSGHPPDLIYTTPRGPGIPAYVRAHRLLNLAGAARGSRWDAALRPGLLTRYNRPFTYFGAQKGAVMAVPTALAAVAVLYNRAILGRLRLKVPRTLASFERALAAAKRAGITPIGMGNADGWLGDDWYLTLVNALTPPSSLESEQRLDASFSFQHAPFVRAAHVLQRWATAAYFTPDFGGLDAQEGIDEFFHGKTLFQLISSSEDPQIAGDQRQTGMPIGVFAFPRSGGGTVMPVSGYEGWAVPAGGHARSTALSFITYLLSRQTADFLQGHDVLPAHAGAAALRSPRAWQRQFVRALGNAQPGVYLDAAPVANLNATMEANVQLLLQGYEPPSFLVKSLQEVYASRGRHGSTTRIDGEF